MGDGLKEKQQENKNSNHYQKEEKNSRGLGEAEVSAAISVLRIKEGQRFETSLGYWDELSMGVLCDAQALGVAGRS